MNKTEFMEGIHILQNNYNQKFSTEKLRLYYEHLQDMDKQEYLDNISKLLKTNEFVPNIAQIRGEENRKAYQNYDQRDYKDIDFDSLYAN